MNIDISVFPNTGCQLHFEPLVNLDESINLEQLCPALHGKIIAQGCSITSETGPPSATTNSRSSIGTAITSLALSDLGNWETPTSWLGLRIGEKIYSFRDGTTARIGGIWVAVETNLGDIGRGLKTGALPPNPEEIIRYNGSAGNLPSPYRFASKDEIPDHRKDCLSLVMRVVEEDLILSKQGESGAPNTGSVTDERNINLTLYWKASGVVNPIDVELIVDFGNTRTAALLLECDPQHNKNPAAFRSWCRKVLLKNPEQGEVSNRDCEDAITDSWFVLKEPLFSSLARETLQPILQRKTVREWFQKRTVEECSQIVKRLPQMFMRLSPAAFGGEAVNEMHLSYTRKLLEKGGVAIQSSPKRYYWDKRPRNDIWSMVPRPNSKQRKNDPEIKSGTPQLDATILRLMAPDGADWTLAEPPTSWPAAQRPNSPRRAGGKTDGTDPVDPRSATMTWMLSGILEEAWRQANSNIEEEGEFKPRKLRRVVATFPSGWSNIELNAYKARWQEAVNIFHLTNNPPGASVPDVVFPIDEAVASQLPIIFSGIEQLGGGGGSYVKLMGRTVGDSAHMRAMNLDIGGGTTDISIIEYQTKGTGRMVDLNTSVLFKYSSSKAGDELVKQIISSIILPQLGSADNSSQEALIRQAVENKMCKEEKIAARMKRVTFVRMVLIPWATRVLQEMSSAGNLDLSPQSLGITLQLWNEFLSWAGIPLKAHQFLIQIQRSWVIRLIAEVFGELVDLLADCAAAFDVDVVILSGKPSELCELRELILRRLPVPPYKIISSKNFHAGSWYPFEEDGCIADAKSVTVTGAALARAIDLTMISGWKLTAKLESSGSVAYQWATLNPRNKRMDMLLFGESELVSDGMQVIIGEIIGRTIDAAKATIPEPIFRLVWVDADQAGCGTTLNGVSFRRSDLGLNAVIEVNPDSKIIDSTGKSVLASALTLELRPTWDDGDYWMDTGCIDMIKWNFTKKV